MRSAFHALLPGLLIASCGGPPPRPVALPHVLLAEAKGRVTHLDASNAPDTIALSPTMNVKAPPFEPLAEGGGAVLHVRTFTTDDGLPMDDIMCGYLDPSGMLWFGTNGGGISRYDGRGFTNFTMADGLPDNVILSLGGDRHGNLWIGTSTGGLCRYDGRSFTTVALNDATGLTKGITRIVEDNAGVLWFGTRGRGLYRYDGTRFSNFTKKDGLDGDHISTLGLASDGALWAATGRGLARFDGRSFRTFAAGDGTDLKDIEAIVGTPDGDLWLGHASGGVTHCTLNDDGTPHFKHHDMLEGAHVPVSEITSVAGALWIASVHDGAFKMTLDRDGVPRFARFGSEQGLASDELLCATIDRHCDVWFGTRGTGVCHYRGGAFANFKGFKPISIAEDAHGTIHIGTANGIARLDGDRFTAWRADKRFGSWNYALSNDAQGRVGFAKNMADLSHAGFSLAEDDAYRVISAGELSADIFWSMHDGRGELWLAGRRGIEHYAHARRVTYTTKQGIGNTNGLCLLETHDGAIWAGTDGGGLSRIESSTITTWTTEEGLPNNAVWCIQEEKGGALWIATLGGLCRFDGKSFLTYTTQNGLPDDNINQVLISREGDLLIGTLNGLAVLTGWKDSTGTAHAFSTVQGGTTNDALVALEPVFEIYNASTGFPVKDVQTAEHTLFQDSKGLVWIATGSDKTALVRFDRNALHTDTVPLAVRLLSVSPGEEPLCWYDLQPEADSATRVQQEMRVFGRALSAGEGEAQRDRFAGVRFTGIAPHFAVPEGLVLDHRNARITFTYVGVETARPEVVEYQHMLVGYDEHWSPPSRANTANYGNIHEGDYTFRVRAKNPAGIWCAPLEYRFTVLPPWYRTWWAYALYVIAAAGALLLYIRLRLSALQRQKEKLERTVAERTEELRRKKEEADQQRERAEFSERAKEQFLANMSHEIRTPMNAIMGMSDILRNRPHAPEQAKYLNAMAQSSENLLVIINDILDLSKIDAGRIEFESVPFSPREVLGNVKDVLQFKAEEKALALTLDVAPDVPGKLIGDPTRLNQIVMNLGGNAIKFTERGSVTIRCRVDPSIRPDERIPLVIDVIDTGIGIPQDRLEKIFEEFTQAYSDTTRKYGGTGLGLTISRRLARLQGGSVTVSSDRDKGSTFSVCIPYARPPAAAH